MPNKITKRAYAIDYTGIDGLASAIEPDDEAGYNRAVNYEWSVSNSLRGRVGCQTTGLVGAYDDVAASTNIFSGNFFGVFPYSYTRTQDQYDIVYQTAAGAYPNQTTSLATTKTAADGASINKLIGLNYQAWVLDTMNITVTYVSGTYPFTWYATVGTNVINFVIKANAVSILSTSLGDGVTSVTSIYTLLSTINALAELSVSRTTRGTCPPFAVVNGNQTTTFVADSFYGSTYSITVDAGHNFSAGDIITFPLSPYQGGMVTQTTATTIIYSGVSVTLLDNMVLGYMNQAATSFNISTVATASSGNLTLSFPYWRLILEGDANSTAPYVFGNPLVGAYTTWTGKSTGSFYAPPTSSNAQGNLYLAASATPSYGSSYWANNLLKVDGATISKAGLPAPGLSLAAIVGAGALTGEYKYKCFLRTYDAQGNITDGGLSPVRTVTYAGADYGQVSVLPPAYTEGTGYLRRGSNKRNTETPAAGASFYVDNIVGGASAITAFIQPGDPVCYTDTVAQKTGLWHNVFGVDVLGTLHRTVCTAYTPLTAVISPTTSSIKVADSNGVTAIPAVSEISAGMTAVVLRTAVGGNQYYVLCEVPFNGFGDVVFFDNVTDATLVAGTQYTEVTLGKEYNPPPPCTLVTQHQGGLVVARGPTTPNTVAFSTADGIEYFPTASNSFDVPSTQSGFITAIASDTNDRLAVCKERAYYDVVGDLDGGTFSINVKNEGDFGITSQASLVRVAGSLVGLSKNGFVRIQDGNLSSFDFLELNTRIVNQKLQYAWAVASNDNFNRQYLCSIPSVTGEPLSYVVDYSRNNANISTFERSFTTKIDQAGGMAAVGDDFYHLSATSPYGVFRRLIRFNGDSPTGNNGDSFIDNTNAISYILETGPINFGEPGQLKTPLRIRTWSLPNDYVTEGWVTFSMLLETGASALATYIGSTNPGASTSTITFSTANDVYKDVKVVGPKTHFYVIRFTTNTIRTAPFFTGYEILFTQNYDKEDFIK